MHPLHRDAALGKPGYLWRVIEISDCRVYIDTKLRVAISSLVSLSAQIETSLVSFLLRSNIKLKCTRYTEMHLGYLVAHVLLKSQFD